MKVVLYTRYANAPKCQYYEAHQQEYLLRNYARQRNYQIVDTITDYCIGLSCDRPALQRILQASSTEYQGVLVSSIDRIGRNMVETMLWHDQLKASGKQLICLDADEYTLDMFRHTIVDYGNLALR